MADPVISGGIRILASSYHTVGDEDVVSVNSWVFATAPPGPATDALQDEAMDELETFYEAIAALYGSQVQEIRIKAYNLGQPPPRDPRVGPTVSVTSSAVGLPSEVSTCLSFFNGVVPRPRRRGRVYIGPIRHALMDTDDRVPVLGLTARTTLATAATNLASLSGGVRWGILSQADSAIYQVDSGWIDNAFDIQRRRGEDPSDRSVWSGS